MEKFLNLQELRRLFPNNESCLAFIENIRWGKTPVCPHCGSRRTSRFKHENRHHCNACNVSFSATVNTIFHNTRIPLHKWFATLALLLESQYHLSARKLAAEINVNKNTAWQMLARLKATLSDARERVSDGLNLETFYRQVEEKVKLQTADILQYVLRKIMEVS